MKASGGQDVWGVDSGSLTGSSGGLGQSCRFWKQVASSG